MSSEQINAMTDVWNAAGTVFTGIGINVTDTASDADSSLLNLKIAGVSKWRVRKDGRAFGDSISVASIFGNEALIGGQVTAGSILCQGALNADSAAVTNFLDVGTLLSQGVVCDVLVLGDTWNNASTVFEAIAVTITDTASDVESRLIRMSVGGSEVFGVRKDGLAIAQAAKFADKAEFDANTTAGNTRMLLWDVDSGALQRVSVGANDSGGAGFKVLRIPN